jgi:signal transduction histidine kinase
MIRDLLDANRLKAGESLHLKISECELSMLLSKIKEELTLIHGDRFILNQGKIKGYWDPSAITRMVENLVNNAVKYGSSNEPITISFKVFDHKVEISVHNKGAPIGAEDQKSIFLQYQRLETSPGRSAGGWGIGLALVLGLAESHGGQVEVRSSAEEGTTFSLILPLDARSVDP